ALQVAVAAHHALEFVGLPEARINLSQATTYLALAPKSNAAYMAITKATEDVQNHGPLPVPKHLKDASGSASRQVGAGKGYEYPHAHGGYVEQQYLPDALKEARYYEAKTGREAELAAEINKKKKAGES
ncbi:MAG: replication-associated recombination protein A, partial [Actinomycetota bacterium]